MKHRDIELTETQERALELATERHDKRVHFVWHPYGAEWESEFTIDEFIEDANKVKMGEWFLHSWSGSITDKRLPIWERIGNGRYGEPKPRGHVCWKQVGYYDPSTGNLVIGD